MIDGFETARLTVRRIGVEDADFVLAILNDPRFLANIGDRGVRTIEDARGYVRDRIEGSYATHGFGMLRVARRGDDRPVGLVGLVKRDGLDLPDLGFAYLADETGRGYGTEAARGLLAAMPDARPLLAITAVDNHASAALLGKLGFVEGERMRLPGYAAESRVFRLDPASPCPD